jgi:hypothetical protein
MNVDRRSRADRENCYDTASRINKARTRMIAAFFATPSISLLVLYFTGSDGAFLACFALGALVFLGLGIRCADVVCPRCHSRFYKAANGWANPFMGKCATCGFDPKTRNVSP